jgi:threonine dehydrogenase-like Zn-dependent dehydrogenase
LKALLFDGAAARVVERPEPAPAAGRAIVRVSLAGVCRTDVELCRGYMGFAGVLGHEFVGTVADGPGAWRGARVVGEINFACGRCDFCARGLGRHCRDRSVMGIAGADGAIAELVSVPVANLHRVPDALDDARAVFTEPLAAAFEIAEQVAIEPGVRALVLGDGKLGLLVAQVLDAAGARVALLGHHAEKLAIAARRGIEALHADSYAGGNAPLVIEATGSVAGLRRAIALTEPRGTLVLKSTIAAHEPLDLAPLVVHEVTVVGSRCGPFAPALAALDAGRIDVASLVTDRFALARAADALARSAERGALKVVIDCS